MKTPRAVTCGWRLAVLLGATACGSLLDQLTGDVHVTVSTSGGDFDLDGYELAVAAVKQTIPVNGIVLVSDVPAGVHEVRLSGLAHNCVATGGNARPVTVSGGEAARVAFAVTCVATGVRVTSATTGVDLDADGYSVRVDGGAIAALGVNATTAITRLNPGAHTVALSGVAPNCSVGGVNPRSVTVAAGEVVPVTFEVSCISNEGSVEVTVASSGVDIDPNGYTVYGDPDCYDYYGYQYCDYLWSQSVAANGTVTVTDVPIGAHAVLLSDVAGNCTVAGDNPRTVTVASGATARVEFHVKCDPVIVSYGATGYRFKVLPDSTTPGGEFESPTFDDVAAGFADGTAAFGSEVSGAGYCPLDITVKTSWPVETDLLVRRTFMLPAGATDVRVRVAIDNDIQVFVNGVDITASAGTDALAGGFQRHGGCATLDSFGFPVPNEILRIGSNLVAIRARDQGGISYLDVSITAVVAP